MMLIEDIMSERVISVVSDDQEDVAQKMRNDFYLMPVIDYQQHLLGIITIDDILDVMDES